MKKTKKQEKNGRPTKHTEEVIEKFIQAMRLSNIMADAAAYAGISLRVVSHWLTEATREGEGSRYWTFLLRVEKAKIEAKYRNIAIIQQGANADWKAAAWLLERRHWQEFARRDQTTVTATVTRPLINTSDDRIAELADMDIENE